MATCRFDVRGDSRRGSETNRRTLDDHSNHRLRATGDRSSGACAGPLARLPQVVVEGHGGHLRGRARRTIRGGRGCLRATRPGRLTRPQPEAPRTPSATAAYDRLKGCRSMARQAPQTPLDGGVRAPSQTARRAPPRPVREVSRNRLHELPHGPSKRSPETVSPSSRTALQEVAQDCLTEPSNHPPRGPHRPPQHPAP
jgi:hypothetical protein